MSLVVASRPPTLTWAFLPKAMPCGLISHTWPLAMMVPSMTDGLKSLMRLRVIDEALGWLNCTVWPCDTLKLFQSMIARCEDWLTVVRPVREVMLACPPVTCPPVGSAVRSVRPDGQRNDSRDRGRRQ